MSSRGALGQSRGAAPGLQPLKATVPFQLACKPRLNRREAGKAKAHQQSGMRRTVSLDAIVGPYLLGHWPKEVDSSFCQKDKSTQSTEEIGEGSVHSSHSYYTVREPQPRERSLVSADKAVLTAPILCSECRHSPLLYTSPHPPPSLFFSFYGPVALQVQTATPDSWSDDSQSRHGISSHKRSASWGSAEHLKEITKLKQQLQQRSKSVISGGHDKDLHGYPHGNNHQGAAQTKPIPIPLAPLLTLVPRLRCSVEGLNQELEGMFICQPSPVLQRFLEVPDGHRAPIPSHSCSSGSQCDHTSTPFSSSSTSSSPCCSPTGISTSPPTSEYMHQGQMESTETCPMSSSNTQNETELPLLMSSSPGPNKSFCFQREPPEGCEKVRVWEETSTVGQPKPTVITSCPDPNKVNFTPHGGSAFCPVNLLKPLLPSMDLLFRSLSVSPASNLTDQSTSGNAPVGSVLEAFGEGLAF